MATIHQKPFGWLWHWDQGPGWVRDGVQIAKLARDGMKVLRVQAQDDGPLSVEQVREWCEAGVKVVLAFGHVDGRGPVELARAMKAEKVRLTAPGATISGLELNGEEDVRKMDEETRGVWSATFAPELRRLCPTLGLIFDTYYGPAAAMPGINLGAYKAAGFKLTLQSYWGDGIWDDPPTQMVEWTSGANPPWPKGVVKPLHRVVRPGSGPHEGELPDWAVVFNDWQKSGLKGGGFYHIDGADFELLQWLFRVCIQREVAYK